MINIRTLILGFLFIGIDASASDMVVKHIVLKYKNARQIKEVIGPMLSGEAAISGHGFNLLLKAKPRRLIQLKKIIAQLDTKPIMIKILVRTVKHNNGSERYIINHYQTQNKQDDVQFIRVLEGRGAMITGGQQRPVVTYINGPFWPGVTMSYKQVKTGIWLTPYIQRGQVVLKIIYKDNQFRHDNTIDLKNMATTIRIPFNRWTVINSEYHHYGKSKTEQNYTTEQSNVIEIKVLRP